MALLKPIVDEDLECILAIKRPFHKKANVAFTLSFSTPLLNPVQSHPQHAIQDSPPTSSEFSCLECCFRCDSDHQWYDLEGKGKHLKS